MPFQLKEIVLYNHNGDRRRIEFKLGAVNILVGKSGTGKSAIIAIIDYCLGRSSFTVPEGVIRDSVAWYAIIIRAAGTEILVAKPAPKPSMQSQSQGLMILGSSLEPPMFDDLAVNTNDEAIEATLSKYLGISPNLHVPEEGHSRDPLEANISHTKFYLFQEQGLVANRDLLFFRQAEPFLPQAMKDTLPYLLGVVDEDRLLIQGELRQMRRQLRMLERDLREAESISGGGITTGRALLAEVAQAGLLDTLPDVRSVAELRSNLQRVADWTPAALPEPGEQRAAAFREEITKLRSELREIAETIQAARAFADHASAYEKEVGEQKSRLESIGVFDDTGGEYACPFCGIESKVRPPAVSELQARLISLQRQLTSVEQERPRLEEYISELENRDVSIRQLIREKQHQLAAVEAEDAKAEVIADQNSRVARVIGRVSLYLESTPVDDNASALKQEIQELTTKAMVLEQRLDSMDEMDLLSSFLNRIGVDMTTLATRLSFEHAEYPLRFDLANLTVLADRPGRPFPMQRMGSAQNWLVCHIVTMLALHRHFRTEQRPVPAFLVLDQPSQVYFPSVSAYRDTDGSVKQTAESGADLQAIEKLFALLFQVVDELTGQFQIIVLEHANLDDEQYQEALVEEAWDGKERALVPPSWKIISERAPTK